MTFNTLGLSPDLLHSVKKHGYDKPTPVQAQAIPAILQGNDLMVTAQTGTGKTAAFTLPLLHRLTEQSPDAKKPVIRALILSPTRELAAQIFDSIQAYRGSLPIKATVAYGGTSIYHQKNKIQRGVDVLVATPGRLLDLVKQRIVNLKNVQFFVLDEADRMLDMGFSDDLREIMKQLPPKRQNLLFSATFSKSIRTLAQQLLKNAKAIDIPHCKPTAERIEQCAYQVDQSRKRELLAFMIGSNNWQRVLVFTRTKHGADRLAKQLAEDGLSTDAIHGNKTQAARTRILKKFKQGKTRILVATDVAARGLDIDRLSHVVNFDLPESAEDYVHRIGRTGRGGESGVAVSLVCSDEQYRLRAIERLLKKQLALQVVEGYEPTEKAKPRKPRFNPRFKRKASAKAYPPKRRTNQTQRRKKHG